MTILIIILILALLASIWSIGYLFFFARHLGRGAHFATTPDMVVARMIKMASVAAGDSVADLGSGDGRLVVAAAQKNAQATGYEINPYLIHLSRRRAQRASLEARVTFKRGDFMKEDLGRYDVILIFGIGFIMARLEEKLQRELRPGTRIVSYYFRFPSWEAEAVEGDVYLYRR